MPYTHFRMIAYEVPTVAPRANSDAVLSGWDPGKLCAASKRLRIPDGLKNLSDDSFKRLRRLAAVVDEAEQKVKALGDNANTLKVFVVPEFYFRPQELGPTYRYHTYPDREAMDILKAIDAMFEHPDFDHWLFICGTVLWNTASDQLRPPLYLNSAIYKVGGLRFPPISVGVTEKRLASKIDGLLEDIWTPGKNGEYVPYHESWGNRRTRVFDHEGTTFGLEICLDHADDYQCRALKQVLEDWPVNEGEIKNVKLQVLTAGGMSIQQRSVAAKVGGYLLRNDGMIDARQSELQRVTGYRVKNALTGAWSVKANYVHGKGIQSEAMLTNVLYDDRVAVPAALCVPEPGYPWADFDQYLAYYPVTAMPA